MEYHELDDSDEVESDDNRKDKRIFRIRSRVIKERLSLCFWLFCVIFLFPPSILVFINGCNVTDKFPQALACPKYNQFNGTIVTANRTLVTVQISSVLWCQLGPQGSLPQQDSSLVNTSLLVLIDRSVNMTQNGVVACGVPSDFLYKGWVAGFVCLVLCLVATCCATSALIMTNNQEKCLSYIPRMVARYHEWHRHRVTLSLERFLNKDLVGIIVDYADHPYLVEIR